MRILIVGWSIGNGSTGVYASELAQYLSLAGHRVTCLSAGGNDWRLSPHLVRRKQGQFEIIDLRNPPVVPCTRPSDPRNEIDSPEALTLLHQVLVQVRPDVVAILDFPGWPARIVDVCHEAGSKVFLYVQNMWPFCTRLSLLDRWGGNCRDYESGRRCVACMENVVSSEAAKWRGRLPGVVWKSARIHGAVKRAYQASIVRTRPRDLAQSGAGYVLRRQAYVEAISQADCVCYISRRTRDLAEQFGVRSTRTLVAPVRLSHIHRVHGQLAAHRFPRATNGRPIRFGYIGAHSPEKGIEVLLHAFAGLEGGKATLTCHGGGGTEYIARLNRLTKAHSGITFHGRYEQRQLSSILQNIDVGVVPSICEDTAPNTVLEFQAAGIPVLGSAIGGIPEQIDDATSGALFEAGNVMALRQCMQRIIGNPKLVSEWAAKLPGDFDPEPSWRQIEHVLCELAGLPAQTHQRSCMESR